jgi:hypothetical protein
MMEIVTFSVFAIIVEAIVEYTTDPIDSFPSWAKAYAGLLVGVVLCVVYGVDILATLGYAAAFPYVGSVLTGLLIGRGSNIANDIIGRIGVVRAPATAVDTIERKELGE